MLTDSVLRSQVNELWNKLWAGGLSNPLDAIEQMSFLFFLKRLEELEEDAVRDATRRGSKSPARVLANTLLWSYWTQLPAPEALKHVKEKVFPYVKALGGVGGAFAQQMANAE